MDRRFRRCTLVVALALLAVACTDDADWSRADGAVGPSTASGDHPGDGAGDDLSTELVRLVDAAATADDVPGVVVGIRWADGSEWIHAAGVGDLSTGERLDPAAQWPARSITKSFTVTALLRLVGEGVVSLDDTVGQFVDGVPGGDEVTLGELALMASGLPDYTNERFAEVFSEDPTRVFDDTELLAFIDGESLESEPGTEHRYINTNTLVLGMALAEVTGATVGEVLDAVTAPLGLEATAYQPEPDVVDAATGYQPDGDGLDEVPLLFGVFGAAGAMSTDLDDLLTWGQALGAGAGVEPDLAAARRDLASPLEEGPEYDSYGLGVGALDGWWGHTGEGLGYTALVMNDPISDTTVAIFSNVSNLPRGHVPTTLFRQMVPALERVT